MNTIKPITVFGLATLALAACTNEDEARNSQRYQIEKNRIENQ